MKAACYLGLCSSLLLLTACAAAAPAASAPGASASVEDAPPDNETARERTIRLAKEKRAECNTLADAIEAEPAIDVIANMNDRTALEGVAAKLDKSAERLAALSVSDPRLAELHQAYVDILRAKAAAPKAMAASEDDADKKKQLKVFGQHDDKVAGTLDGINDACSSAPGIVSEPEHETRAK